ncbi:PREDICTED: claudin-8-like [Nanorana parkeri]|uniref:claudin-8-like n=1 Tax=Nanorana parkeri TaxID=125878 RepID=UPI000853F997|nr:PREDICTED: claudin-8-like [Nanorana parkeri]
MVHCIVQSIAMILGGIAMILTFAVCGMPHWRVSIVAESNSYGRRLDGHWISRWDGLWVTCVRQSGSSMSCQSYSASNSLTPDLKISKALMSFAVLAAITGFLNGLIGMLFNKCCKKNTGSQRCLLLFAGISYIIAGILVLMPVTLVAVNVMRAVCFSYCKIVQQQEIGEAVMLGWPTALLFLIGGSIFCWYHPCQCRNGSCVHISDECQLHPHPCPEEKPLARELRVFRLHSRKNEDIRI